MSRQAACSPTCYNNADVKLPGQRYERRPGRTSRSKLPMLVQSTFSFPAPEEWRPVVGYEGRYEVSDLGRVRSLWNNRGNANRARVEPLVMRLRMTKTGYFRIGLSADGRPRMRFVHQLVLEAFVGPRPVGLVTGHLNGNPGDNRPENLRWITPKENTAHRILHGTVPTGDRNGTSLYPERVLRGERANGAKLTAELVVAIRAAAAAGARQADLARRYGVKESALSSIVLRKTWRHLPEASDER